MPNPPFEARLNFAQRRRATMLTFLACLVLSVLTFAVAAHLWQNGRAAGLFWALLAGAGALAGTVAPAYRRWGRKVAKAQLHADERGLFADGVLVLARTEIRSAYLQPRAPEPPLVRFVVKGPLRGIDVAVHDAAEGTRLLAALDLDPARTVAHFDVREGLFASKRAQAFVAALTMGFGFQMFQIVPGPYRLPVMFVWLVLLFANLKASRMSIGVDGILVTSTFRKKFYSFANVVSVKASSWGIVLETRAGKTVELRTRAIAMPEEKVHDEETMAIVARIQSGIDELAGRGGAASGPAALVARGSRTYDAWLSALRELGSGGMYRVSALPHEQLWRVVEDPTASAGARAGAAMALRASLEHEGQARLRVVAEASASPRVRVALGAIAKGDAEERELREALEACDSEAQRADEA